jgi:hypothetical protein
MVRHHRRIAPAVGLALALATAAPAAAMPQHDPPTSSTAQSGLTSTQLCSEVCSASGYGTATSGATLPHDPRPRAVALAGAGYGYGSTPVASTAAGSLRSEVVSGAGYGNPNAATTVVRVSAPADGFDWGDAGIGAGGTLALLTLLGGSAFAVTNSRRRTGRSTA